MQMKLLDLNTSRAYKSCANELYIALKILCFNDIFKLEIPKIMHKFKNNSLPFYLQ